MFLVALRTATGTFGDRLSYQARGTLAHRNDLLVPGWVAVGSFSRNCDVYSHIFGVCVCTKIVVADSDDVLHAFSHWLHLPALQDIMEAG